MIKLIVLRWVVRWRYLREWLQVVYRYYRCGAFLQVDLALWWCYFFRGPYAICKRFLQQRGDCDVYQYGETPLTTLEAMVAQFGIARGETVYELGCGSGRTVFWFRLIAGCRAIGIEQVPRFVVQAQRLAERLELRGVDFIEGDLLQMEYQDADWLYLYGTCFSDDVIRRLVKNLKRLKRGTKVVTVSYPLSDYAADQFAVLKEIELPFTWGRAAVYLNEKC